MSRRFLLGTRKGLFTWERTESGWSAADVSFLADPVTAVLADPRDGAWYAALNLGHYGAKLHRSRDEGRSWEECEAPVFPEKPAEAESLDPPDKNPWSLQLIWCLEAGGAEEAGRLWAGTIPGGLFRSDDHGSGWELVRSLWDRAERREWFGAATTSPASTPSASTRGIRWK